MGTARAETDVAAMAADDKARRMSFILDIWLVMR